MGLRSWNGLGDGKFQVRVSLVRGLWVLWGLGGPENGNSAGGGGKTVTNSHFPTDGLLSPPETTLANVVTTLQVSVTHTHKAQDRRTINVPLASRLNKPQYFQY